jgi:hypothetical protein
MSQADSLAAPVAAPQTRSSVAGWLVLLSVVLAGFAGLVARDALAMRSRAVELGQQLSAQAGAVGEKAIAADAALSPVVLTHVKSTQALLKKGDKAGAKAELKRAQTLAVALRSVGTGHPSAELVASLTEVEKAFGQTTPTLMPTPKAGGT